MLHKICHEVLNRHQRTYRSHSAQINWTIRFHFPSASPHLSTCFNPGFPPPLPRKATSTPPNPASRTLSSWRVRVSFVTFAPGSHHLWSCQERLWLCEDWETSYRILGFQNTQGQHPENVKSLFGSPRFRCCSIIRTETALRLDGHDGGCCVLGRSWRTSSVILAKRYIYLFVGDIKKDSPHEEPRFGLGASIVRRT